MTTPTSISGAASYAVLRFLSGNGNDANGLDNTQTAGTLGLNRRINARSSAGVNASYAIYNVSGPQSVILEPDFQTRGLNLSYQRILSRTLSVSLSAGPQSVSSSNSALIPTSLNLAVTASLSYAHRYTHASVSYSRGVNGGSGVIPGAFSDSLSAGVGRAYGRDWVVSLSAAYVRTSGLTQFNAVNSQPINAVFNTVYGGGTGHPAN